jgi:HAD superfamily hydrolase (TIGR01509 family)
VIRAVTFDFWQTLADDTADNLAVQRRLRLEALHAALTDSGVRLDAATVEAGYERSQGLLESRFWDRHRDPGFPEQVALVLDCMAPGAVARLSGPRLDALLRGYAEPVLRCPPVLCPGATEAVRGLAARGIALGIVSNTGRTPGLVLRQYLERHDLLRYFRAVSFSDEVGVRKPDAEIFRRALAKLGPEAGISAAETAHVGDNPHADVEGAQSFGMRAVHYVAGGRPASARADLVVTDLATLPERLAAL